VMRAVDARTLAGLSAAPGSAPTGQEVPAPSAAAEAPTAPPVTSSPDAVDPMVERDLASCAGPAVVGTVTLPATLDGRLVALVFRTPSQDQQVVEAWSCDGATVLATATIPR
jgi:hypothetical protein